MFERSSRGYFDFFLCFYLAFSETLNQLYAWIEEFWINQPETEPNLNGFWGLNFYAVNGKINKIYLMERINEVLWLKRGKNTFNSN